MDAKTNNQNKLFMQRLTIAWLNSPHLRLGQLLVNACGDKDLFYVDDTELLERVEEFVNDHK